MLEFCLENGNEMAVVPFPRTWGGEGKPPIETTFGWGHVIQSEQLADGRSNILLEGLGTAKLVNYLSEEPFKIANIRKISQDISGKFNPIFKEMLDEILLLTKRILLAEGAEESIIMKMNHIAKHVYPIDFIASMLNFEYSLKQDILETTNIVEKSVKLLTIVRTMNLQE